MAEQRVYCPNKMYLMAGGGIGYVVARSKVRENTVIVERVIRDAEGKTVDLIEYCHESNVLNLDNRDLLIYANAGEALTSD